MEYTHSNSHTHGVPLYNFDEIPSEGGHQSIHTFSGDVSSNDIISLEEPTLLDYFQISSSSEISFLEQIINDTTSYISNTSSSVPIIYTIDINSIVLFVILSFMIILFFIGLCFICGNGILMKYFVNHHLNRLENELADKVSSNIIEKTNHNPPNEDKYKEDPKTNHNSKENGYNCLNKKENKTIDDNSSSYYYKPPKKRKIITSI